MISIEETPWIAVRNENFSSVGDSCGDIDAAQTEFRQLPNVSPEEIQKLAKKYGILCGKWMLFAPSDKIDEMWGTVAKVNDHKKHISYIFLGPTKFGDMFANF